MGYIPTDRVECNTIFGKTTQGSEKPNKKIEDLCPVRLFKKMIAKQTLNIKTSRLFLTPNKGWTRCAENVADIKKTRTMNHSNRSSAVNVLESSGANLQEIIIVTDLFTPNSLKLYLKLSETTSF
ncbi:hypothetical protein Zmor_013789 [Zophobas morio]|uniref:Uncharacterized protein n=1 Tax=Zophobas morio TaxID=2755281 RepID=A0AA38IJJ8_9CUCU|nr:hypothetical protein Zmor_013789 [Zophobas morio]